MRALITGITGFVGRHLVEHLRKQRPDVELFGLRRWRSTAFDGAALWHGVHLLDADLLDAASLQRALDASRPDWVFHLGASSSVAGSWDTPAEMVQVNVLGTLHLLEALRQSKLSPKVVIACSAEPYGAVPPEQLPIREDVPFHPVSPYAVSKAAADMFAYQYFRTFGLRTVRLRLFNHCGPGQSSRFVISSLAHQIAEIELGLRPPRIEVGNIEVRRDFIDVRDAVHAYVLAAERGRDGEAYNVASGVARSIREVLDTLLAMSPARVDVAPEVARLRPSDIEVLQGDSSHFEQETGWRPEIPFEQTLRDTLAWWRTELHHQAPAV